MPKLTVYVPAMKLKVIDLYCEEKKIPRSALLVNCAVSFINATHRNIKCDYCAKPALGKYSLVVYDWSSGEKKEIKNLCEYHVRKAENEGTEVTEIE
ncbi:MAG: hypothetical protein PHS33_09370 [Candidatus Omnitrophica bacterium]|nr:hypothetical protein [Candidatus Omnitrophota bacterium]